MSNTSMTSIKEEHLGSSPIIKVGYWWSEKKTRKFNIAELAKHCKQRGIELIKLDLDQPLDDQGPFAAIIHKLSDVLVKADQGDEESKSACNAFESFVKRHPEMVIIDPLDNVRKLLDRYRQYKLVEESELGITDGVFTPAFVELTTTDVQINIEKLRSANLSFPVVCKPSLAHGSTLAHQMTLVFGEHGLKDISPPCVAQTFVCHGAVLYKLFIIGDKYYITERPSLKNFKAQDQDSIFFDSHDISKPHSASVLIKLDEEDCSAVTPVPLKSCLDRIVQVLQCQLGLNLFGIDVIVESATGRYAIIDMNTFPGYDGVDNLWEAICDLILEKIAKHQLNGLCSLEPPISKVSQCLCCPVNTECLAIEAVNLKSDSASFDPSTEDSGIDTSDSCDEKKKLTNIAAGKNVRRQHSRNFLVGASSTKIA